MVLWVVTLGWIVPGSSSGAGTDAKVPGKKPAMVDKQRDHKEAADVRVEDPPKEKQVDVTEPIKNEGPEDLPPKDHGEEDKVQAGDAKKTSEAGSGVKKVKGDAKEDRPWIIKERDRVASEIPKKKKSKSLKWKNEEQQVQCDTHLKAIRKSLDKARLFSVRGDTCATAKHAGNFMDLTKRCKNECPEGFLESKGYSEKIMKNVGVLLELGKKACLD